MTSDSSSLPPHLTISNIEKGTTESGQKFIKITGNLQGHDVTLIISLEGKNKRDSIIKKIKSEGLTFSKQLANNHFSASTGGKKQIGFHVKVDSSEKSLNFSHMAGSKLLVTEKIEKKEQSTKNTKGTYTTLQTSPKDQQRIIVPEKGKHEEILPAAPDFVPLWPRTESSMTEDIMKSPYFRADMNPQKAAKALQHPSILPGTVIVCKSHTYPGAFPFVAAVKLPDGTVSHSLMVIEKTAHDPVYRIKDAVTLGIKLGGGAGYANLVDSLNELSKYELAQAAVMLKPLPPLPAAQLAIVNAKAILEIRATQLFQDLQGMKGTLHEMGCQGVELDGILKNLCYDIAAFERSGQNEMRIRKNSGGFHELGITLPFTFYISKKPEGQGVNIQMITPGVVKGAVIGEGAYKVVKTNYEIDIPATGSSQAVAISSREVVLLRAKKGYETVVIASINIVNKLRLEIGPDVIPGTFAEHRYHSKTGKERVEFNQVKFNGDYAKMIKEGQLPLRRGGALAAVAPGGAGMIRLNLRHKLDALVDVSSKISRFHAAGYIHRDVKPPNMLIELVELPNQPPRVVGIPADYDLTTKACVTGTTKEGRLYPYWDPLGREGIVTTNSDVYGLAYSLGETLLPNFLQVVASRTQIDENKDFATCMYDKTYNKLTELGLLNDPIGQQLLRELHASPPNFPNYCRKVEEYLNYFRSASPLSAEKMQALQEFQAEVSILPHVWRLIVRVMHESAELQRDVYARPHLVLKFSSNDPQQAQEGIIEVMALAKQRRIPTAQEFSNYLQTLRDRLPA